MKRFHYGLLVLSALLNFVKASDEAMPGQKHTREGTAVAAAAAAAVATEEDLDPLYQGQYVTVSGDGVVHIRQRLYPNFRGTQKDGMQFFSRVSSVTYANGKYYCQVGEPIFEHEMIFWQMKEIPESDVPFVPQPVEVRLTEAPYEIVSEADCKEMPYFSCGRLDLTFPPLVPGGIALKGSGSAAAIENNILVTAAHNFLPPSWNGARNSEKVRAHHISFLHVKTRGKERVACEVSTLHCFVHPEWEKNFNPHCDIAFVCLNQSLVATAAEKEKLLRLRILPPTMEHDVQVIGYPLGVEEMRRTTGSVQVRDDRPADAMNIIYHTANTEKGHSGSPVVKEGGSLIGVHTRAPSPGGTANRAVRVRLDLMPFLDAVIAENQEYLANAELYEARKAAAKLREERERAEAIEARARAKGEARGRAEGEARGRDEERIRMARDMIADGDNNDKIARITKLTPEQVQALRLPGS